MRIVYNAHSVHRSRVQKGKSCDCINFVKATDPPYNTGHDFVYPDSFKMADEDYEEGTGYLDADGNINYSKENHSSSGKYHSDWCSMMYSRLMLARTLLSPDGLIFISINEIEQANLEKICDEVFGASNHVSTFVWKNKYGPGTFT